MDGFDRAYVLEHPVKELDALAFIEDVHPSWLLPVFAKYSEEDIRFALGVLAPWQVDILSDVLRIQPSSVKVTSLGRLFIQRALCTALLGNRTIIPRQYLAKTSFDALYALPCNLVIELIDRLGLRDLAVDMRKMIEKARINKIYGVLTPAEKVWVQDLMQHQEPILFKAMGIYQGELTESVLRAFVRQRGLNRLAKALYGQQESLIWYIQHKVDKALGEGLQALCVPTVPSHAGKILEEQVVDALSFIKKERL